jgi:hypothetical protein
MKKFYESMQGDNGSIAVRLNEVSVFCKNIKVLNSMPLIMQHGITNAQVPGVALLLEIEFNSEEDQIKYEAVVRPQKLSLAK